MAKRFPVQIDNWQLTNGDYSSEELLKLLYEIITDTLQKCKNPGILLSGGIDSSLLAILANKITDVPCFTIGSNLNHPDIVASMKLSNEFNLNHYIYIPNEKTNDNLGDLGVFMALDFASKFATDIISGDGIDEQMGGYWWHINKSDLFPTAELAYKYFWDNLEINHLTPMFESAKKRGVNLFWPYLHPEIIRYISKIPLEERVKDGVGKVFWRDVAKLADVPEWVIQRPKRGFVDALVK